MRGVLLGVILLSACGGANGGGDNNPVVCTGSFQPSPDWRHCAVDSDCHVVIDDCSETCGAYVNADHVAAASAAIADERNACQCGTCMAPAPAACVDGSCGSVLDECNSLMRQISQIALANQGCSQDSDCSFVPQLDGCDVFTNATGQTQMADLAARFAADHFCRTCQPKTPHCTNGSCAVP